MKWIKDIKPEELPEQYQEMVEVIGLENTMLLVQKFGKTGFYFRGLDALIEKKKKEYVRKKHDGSRASILKLARETDYSERWIYVILGEKDDRQENLF